MKLVLAPSILSADFNNLGAQLKKIEEAGIGWIHFDVMDGHFVPNISFGVPVLDSISRGKYNLRNDVHLMVSDPEKYIEPFIEAGANILTIHYESIGNVQEAIRLIKIIQKHRILAGISIKPDTNVYEMMECLAYADVCLVMTVEPGFGGQSFIEKVKDKLFLINGIKQKEHLDFVIEVDGGIDLNRIKELSQYGVEMFVSGSYIFKNLDKLPEIVAEVKKI